MLRRAMAIAMLLLAAASCMSQGLSLVMCRCSGDVFVGHAPESCCADCTSEEAAAPNETDSCNCPIASQGCFDVFSRGWDKYTPAAARDAVPPPTVADASDAFSGFTPLSFTPPLAGIAREAFHHPEPPGRPRSALYGSLRL